MSISTKNRMETKKLQNVSLNKRLEKHFWITQTIVTVDRDIYIFKKTADRRVVGTF